MNIAAVVVEALMPSGGTERNRAKERDWLPKNVAEFAEDAFTPLRPIAVPPGLTRSFGGRTQRNLCFVVTAYIQAFVLLTTSCLKSFCICLSLLGPSP